jgi:N,N'-diacetyllegionaminate synthase
MQQAESTLVIETKTISSKSAFIIAEIGSNHGQNLEQALQYTTEAIKCGADAIKFQFFDADDIVSADHPARGEVEGYVTPIEWIPVLQKKCQELGAIFFASTFNNRLFRVVDDAGVPLHKIASSEVLNPSLLLAAGRSNKPVLISLGMSEWYEAEIAMKILHETGNANIVPMHCIARYPLETEYANLLLISKLSQRFNGLIGFSDHTESVEIGGWAAMLGARVFEKHFTLDRNECGADHGYALEPKEFKTYVDNIRNAIKALGNGTKTYLPEELNGRRRLGLYASERLEAGGSLEDLNLQKTRPRTKVPENLLSHLKALRLRKALDPGVALDWSDLE